MLANPFRGPTLSFQEAPAKVHGSQAEEAYAMQHIAISWLFGCWICNLVHTIDLCFLTRALGTREPSQLLATIGLPLAASIITHQAFRLCLTPASLDKASARHSNRLLQAHRLILQQKLQLGGIVHKILPASEQSPLYGLMSRVLAALARISPQCYSA